MKHKFEIKVAAIFAVVICVIIGSYFIAFGSVFDRHEYTLLADESMNTLQAMKQSCKSLIETANNYSKMMLADEEMQKILNTGDIYGSPRNQSKLSNRIYGLLQFDQNISSVYFVDKKNQIFTVGEDGGFYPDTSNPLEMEWYKEIENKKGGYILTQGNEWGRDSLETEYISLIRKYHNLEDFSQSGVLAVNINMDAIKNLYGDSLNKETEEILFLDKENQIILQDGIKLLEDESIGDITKEIKQSSQGEYNGNTTISNKKYIVSGVYLEDAKWRIIRVIPISAKRENIYILTINVVLVIISTILILLGTFIVSRMMTVPIQRMLSAMSLAEDGKFVKIKDKAFFHEFRYLFEGYNRLLDKVDQLLLQTIEKQKVIRRIELNEMHEQMKPHFLYNTLDSIEALAMMDEKEKLCDIVEALGDFYRKSVSKGREMISIQDEMTIVTDYIRIMSIRFENLFEAYIEVQDGCRAYLLPKLTLQPIVENSIHHGLREREEKGHLWIRIEEQDEWLHISIADDGIGFSEELLDEIEEESTVFQDKSYGLRGTIERLRLVYGEAFKYKVTSEPFTITNISFYIHQDSLEGGKGEEIKGNIGR